ncbi:MAG: hypothetical protein Q4C89_03435 [Deinococcus sp.]|uniref:hypothetical protein n=1 Tax=Deinococcus sp. TaxID=47478 RepID=UPI0026DBCDB2|nr:hypothetical protein [Deinococcus sp.]MDO4245059.1 hypothetical protein [Deinococcus sp.]
MIRSWPTRPAPTLSRPLPEASAPARVSARQLPSASDLGWGMVNLALLTLLAGVAVRFF